MDAARSTAKTHHSRARAGMQNMVTGAKNPTSTKRPHHSALASRKKPTQTHPYRCYPRKRLYRARYYHAELGRFISRDPIGYVDGMNVYRAYFVPTMVDSQGLAVKLVCSWGAGGEQGAPVVEITVVGRVDNSDCTWNPFVPWGRKDCDECGEICKGIAVPSIEFKAFRVPQGGFHPLGEFDHGVNWSLKMCGEPVALHLSPGEGANPRRTLSASVQGCPVGCCDGSHTQSAFVFGRKTKVQWLHIKYTFDVKMCGRIENENLDMKFLLKGSIDDPDNHFLDCRQIDVPEDQDAGPSRPTGWRPPLIPKTGVID